MHFHGPSSFTLLYRNATTYGISNVNNHAQEGTGNLGVNTLNFPSDMTVYTRVLRKESNASNELNDIEELNGENPNKMAETFLQNMAQELNSSSESEHEGQQQNDELAIAINQGKPEFVKNVNNSLIRIKDEQPGCSTSTFDAIGKN